MAQLGTDTFSVHPHLHHYLATVTFIFPYLALQQAHEQALALRGDVRREAELRVEDLLVHPQPVLQFCFLVIMKYGKQW